MCVDCLLLQKYELKKSTVFFVKLNSCCSLWISLECDIVSYAFDKSTYIASVGICFLLSFWILLMIVCSAVVVLEFGLKAYCVGI